MIFVIRLIYMILQGERGSYQESSASQQSSKSQKSYKSRFRHAILQAQSHPPPHPLQRRSGHGRQQRDRQPESQSGAAAEPGVTRGQDPELFWMHKYGPEDDQTAKEVDIRSLYRHEHISPELLIVYSGASDPLILEV